MSYSGYDIEVKLLHVHWHFSWISFFSIVFAGKGQKFIVIESNIWLLFVLLFEMLPFITALRHFFSSAKLPSTIFPRFLLVACYCFELLLGPGAGIYKEMSGAGAVLLPHQTFPYKNFPELRSLWVFAVRYEKTDLWKKNCNFAWHLRNQLCIGCPWSWSVNSFICMVLMFENRFNHDKSENNVLRFIVVLHAFVSGCLDFKQSFSWQR